jgi:hypothetical protein
MSRKKVVEFCSVEGCEELAHAKHLCNTHYRRFLKYGSPSALVVESNKGKQCSVEGCENQATRKGLCNMHRQRKRKYGTFDLPEPKTCSVEGCDRDLKRGGLGMCSKHYQRFKRHGDVNQEPPVKKTKCKKCGEESSNVVRGLCKNKCYNKYMNDTCDTYKNSKKLSKYKRRTAERRKTEPFTTEEILDKTGGLCSLCFEEINLSLPQTHALGLNIDHIQPLSKGGSNMKYNLLAAHRLCNESKGNKWPIIK